MVRVARGWWTWLAALAALVWGLVAYEAVSRPTRLRIEGLPGILLQPVAVDTGGACRIAYWPQRVRILP